VKTDTQKRLKPKPKLTDEEQSERFMGIARRLGVDESGSAFGKVATKLTLPK
jgi:hypothetical protein